MKHLLFFLFLLLLTSCGVTTNYTLKYKGKICSKKNVIMNTKCYLGG